MNNKFETIPMTPVQMGAYINALGQAGSYNFSARISHALLRNMKFADQVARKINTFGGTLLQKHGAQMEEDGKRYKFVSGPDGSQKPVFAIEESRLAYEAELEQVNRSMRFDLSVYRIPADWFGEEEGQFPATLLMQLQVMLTFEEDTLPTPPTHDPNEPTVTSPDPEPNGTAVSPVREQSPVGAADGAVLPGTNNESGQS